MYKLASNIFMEMFHLAQPLCSLFWKKHTQMKRITE